MGATLVGLSRNGHVHLSVLTYILVHVQVYECNVTQPGGCSDVPSTFFIEDDEDGSIKLRLCGPTDYQMTFDDEVLWWYGLRHRHTCMRSHVINR